jgi:tRNA-dihydrouridine synthase B
MQFGSLQLSSNLFAAPMAGISDRPYRQICRKYGAGLTYSEMTSARPDLRQTKRSQQRRDLDNEPFSVVQIAGSEPQQLAAYAYYNYCQGAQLIDINMGCPAKKVCHQAAGSSLMRDERLVKSILKAVVNAIPIPVSLKIRTGWCPDSRNGVKIAQIAEDSGIHALTVHGRTRADKFKGNAEYETVKAIKQTVKIPVIANGDIISPEKAKFVLEHTGVDALMIGRGAQGRPWIFREIAHYLKTGDFLSPPKSSEIKETLLSHMSELHQYYGEHLGLKIARKHLTCYLQHLQVSRSIIKKINLAGTTHDQQQLITELFDNTE